MMMIIMNTNEAKLLIMLRCKRLFEMFSTNNLQENEAQTHPRCRTVTVFTIKGEKFKLE